MATNGGPNIIEDGLVFAVDAANKKSYPGSGTTWSDLSGNGNNGTLTNGPIYNSSNGGYIELDGTNDFIDTSFDATSYFPLTICAWVNINNQSGVQIIVDQSTGAAGLGFRTNSSNIDAFWYQSATTNLSTVITGFSADVWNYACVVYSTNNMKGYLNGVLSNSPTISLTEPGRSLDTTNDMDIGKLNDNTSNYIDAKIAQIKIYNRALTPSEITQNYNALKGRFGL